jgi:hypothetical protein
LHSLGPRALPISKIFAAAVGMAEVVESETRVLAAQFRRVETLVSDQRLYHNFPKLGWS